MEQIVQKSAQRQKHPVNDLKLDTVKWLTEKYNIDLRNEDAQEMAAFLILWTLFEQKVLRASEDISNEITRKAPSIKAEYKGMLEHINRWYILNRPEQYIFDKFNFRGNLKSHVESYLKAEVKNEADEKIFVIGVIYKYRCNLFHGRKDINSLATRQASKFKEFNSFLISCLETSI